MTIGLMPAIACLFFGAVQAAGANKTNVARDCTDSVAPANVQACEAGNKSYNQCLTQHGFKYPWTVWMHETSDVCSY
jgi:hypothetical protein